MALNGVPVAITAAPSLRRAVAAAALVTLGYVGPRLTATDRREQLLAVAREAFARAGYHDTSMNDVAEAAGVTKPVLYQHFESKRELFQALLDDVGAQMTGAIEAATAGEIGGKQRTIRGFQAYFGWVHDNRDAFTVLFGGGSRQDPEFARAIRHVTAQAAAAIAPLIDAGIDTDHQQMLAHAIVGISEGASRWLIEQGDEFDPDLVAERISGLAWAGLRSLGQSPTGELPRP